MKGYTDLEQSKKLAEILPIKSADMGWNVFVDKTTRALPIDDWALVKNGSDKVKFYPAWSLAALLDILSKIAHSIDEDGSVDLCDYKNIEWSLCLTNTNVGLFIANNPVDACVEVIIKLHELNLL